MKSFSNDWNLRQHSIKFQEFCDSSVLITEKWKSEDVIPSKVEIEKCSKTPLIEIFERKTEVGEIESSLCYFSPTSQKYFGNCRVGLSFRKTVPINFRKHL